MKKVYENSISENLAETVISMILVEAMYTDLDLESEQTRKEISVAMNKVSEHFMNLEEDRQ